MKNNSKSASLVTALVLMVLESTSAVPVDASCEAIHIICNSSFHDTLVEDGFNILSEETLSVHCNDILEDITCKRDYLSRCNPESYETFAVSTDGIVEVLSELCNATSNLRKAYRLHSHCIANISDAYQDCIVNTAERVAEEIENPSEYDFLEEDITFDDVYAQRLCLFYDPFKDCITHETNKACGAPAAQFVEDMIIRMARAAVRAKCRNRAK